VLRLAIPQSFKVPATLACCGNLFVALRSAARPTAKFTQATKVREELIHKEKK
jgi:hypothetical protein